MSFNKRCIIESFVFSAIFFVIYYAIQIVRGYFLSIAWVPNMQDSNQTMESLQSSASFGSYVHIQWLSIVLFILVAGIYYTLRRWMHGLNQVNS